MNLSNNSQKIIEKILKHYPMASSQTEKENINNHSAHKKPNQHLHDYRKVPFF